MPRPRVPIVVPVCAAIESEIVELDEAERAEFLADLGLDEPGLNRVVRAGYRLLGLETYFTVGPKEARAWTIPKGAPARRRPASSTPISSAASSAPRSSATTTSSPARASRAPRRPGKLRSEGKEYIVRDGDVVHFRFNV
jgi:ribosome-binding ATPase YchF (GTP1/OBG family)